MPKVPFSSFRFINSAAVLILVFKSVLSESKEKSHQVTIITTRLKSNLIDRNAGTEDRFDTEGREIIHLNASILYRFVLGSLLIIPGRGRRLRAANQLRVNRTALPFSHPHVTPQSQSLPSNRFARFTL
ncbi:hypothetical protein J6590_086790 [Homalodisca vitripennis]|nr:hypothetical protein J6590_086790 [Homalodisca vitripennis]